MVWGSAGDERETIRINAGPRALHQEGQAVFRWATTALAPVALRGLRAAGVDPADAGRVRAAPGQPAHHRGIAKRLRAKRPRRHGVAEDIVESGNTSSASIPLALAQLRRARARCRSGDPVLLFGFGARPDLRRPGRPSARETTGLGPEPVVEPVRREHREGTTHGHAARSTTGLAEILEEVAGVTPADVTEEKSFTDDLDVDSLSMVEIVVAAEEKFGVKIPDDELQNLKTVGDAVNYIEKNQ